MTDDNETRSLDAVGTTGGKATVETTRRSRARADVADWFAAARDHRRDDTLIGEIVRICLRLDKAGFAKVYAVVKAEEALMESRFQEHIDTITRRSDDPST